MSPVKAGECPQRTGDHCWHYLEGGQFKECCVCPERRELEAK